MLVVVVVGGGVGVVRRLLYTPTPPPPPPPPPPPIIAPGRTNHRVGVLRMIVDEGVVIALFFTLLLIVPFPPNRSCIR